MPSSTADSSSGVFPSSSTSVCTDTITVPFSAMVVVAVAGVPTAAVPLSVVASVSVTDSVSPGSRTSVGLSVAIAIDAARIGLS